MAAPCPLLGDGITNDTLFHIAHFLPSARDLLCLQLTCPRFAAKIIAAPRDEAARAAAAPEMLSIPEEAGRRRVAACGEQERGWVPRRELESWLGLMHELEVLRQPLTFDRAHAAVTLFENGAVATRYVQDGSFQMVASKMVMRSGRHFVQFTLVEGKLLLFGVIRPGWDVEAGVEFPDQEGVHAPGHCFYFTYDDGSRYPGYRKWQGMQPAKTGDRIGMLLDLDQGSMTVWKNDVRLGVMQGEGLSGPLCWAVSLFRGSTRIESAPAPPSPTEEELAVEKVWQVAA